MTIQPSLSAIVHNPSLPQDFITDIFPKLSRTKTKDEIFQAGVEIIYQALNCDRAVIYSLQSDSYCKVVAEAVTPGYAQILGLTITDNCFESGYIEKYQKGRVRAITDVRSSGIALCHVETLEKIQVKANLVVPLIKQDSSLLGLLVMHQCSRTRQWEQSEVEFSLQIADWIIEQVKDREQTQNIQAQIENIRQNQKILEQITQELHTVQDSNTVLQLAVERAKELLKCDRVVVYGLEDRNLGEIVAESTLPSLAPTLGTIIIDPCLEFRYREKYQDGRVRAIDNIYEAGMTRCYIENLEKIAVKSNIVVPLNLDNGIIYGLLVAHQCFQFREWQQEEIDCLQKIAFQAGLSLSKTKLKEKMQLVESNLSKLEKTRERLTVAKLQLKQNQKPIEETFSTLIEINNLNKLLNREINLINQNSSNQTKKDTKLIQIFARKLALHTIKLQESLDIFNNQQDAVENLIDDLIMNFRDY